MSALTASRTVVALARPEFSESIYGATYAGRLSSYARRVEPPMALMQLGAALVGAGHEVSIVDGEVENLGVDRIVDRICQARPDVVGVTATTPEYHTARPLSRSNDVCRGSSR